MWAQHSMFVADGANDVRAFAIVVLPDTRFFLVVTVGKLKYLGLVVETVTNALENLSTQPSLKVLNASKLTRRLQSLFGWGDVSMSEEDVGRTLTKAITDDDFTQMRRMTACLMPPIRRRGCSVLDAPVGVRPHAPAAIRAHDAVD